MVTSCPESLMKPMAVRRKLLMGPGPANCSPRVLNAAGEVIQIIEIHYQLRFNLTSNQSHQKIEMLKKINLENQNTGKFIENSKFLMFFVKLHNNVQKIFIFQIIQFFFKMFLKCCIKLIWPKNHTDGSHASLRHLFRQSAHLLTKIICIKI